ERLAAARNDPAAFERELALLLAATTARAEARLEGGKIPLELAFYRAQFFTRALVLFLLAFLAAAVSWMVPWRGLTVATWLAAIAGELVLVAGIVVRCVLRERPPVSTLYETILFIAAVGVAVALFVEWANRRRVALGTATVIGMLGMFLSLKYELKEAATAGDTMPSLVAVLDTNFWLSTHVTTVTMGYAAGLLASALAHVWLLGRMLGLRRGDPGFYSSLTRTVYGVTAFGLVFATVGTILGGIWANYSWGRFWGWDPKENGALMIVLWMLMMVHARLGGYVRQFGLNLLAVGLGLVVAFSWWGVNLLGVGLHSYGFTSGVARILFLFYGVELAVGVAALAWYGLVGKRRLSAAERPG
ncbi:MAG TPA: cytochrome c biogenesis protein CcsA, partial [Planctomycetota bacterium]|nr:cytochrome c biogenesis protein CcsA [Planctomycetota bacterium]